MHAFTQDVHRTLQMIGTEQWIEIYDNEPVYRYKDHPHLLYRGKVAYICNTPESWMKKTILRNNVFAIYAVPDRFHGTKIILETERRKDEPLKLWNREDAVQKIREKNTPLLFYDLDKNPCAI